MYNNWLKEEHKSLLTMLVYKVYKEIEASNSHIHSTDSQNVCVGYYEKRPQRKHCVHNRKHVLVLVLLRQSTKKCCVDYTCGMASSHD